MIYEQRMDERMAEKERPLKPRKYCVEHDLSHLAAIKTHNEHNK